MKPISMTKKIEASIALALILLSANAMASAAAPTESKDDYFGRSTGPAPSAVHVVPKQPEPIGPRPLVTQASSPEQWFEALDDYVGYYRPSDVDKYIINQNFNQEVERVMDFCKAAGRIAKNYNTLSAKLHALPIPMSIPEAKTYRDLCANWYSDSAQVYQDMVRPRPPARTQEELSAMLKDITDRSESLKESYNQLAMMDSKIRQKYSIHPPRYDDALFQYYDKGKPH